MEKCMKLDRIKAICRYNAPLLAQGDGFNHRDKLMLTIMKHYLATGEIKSQREMLQMTTSAIEAFVDNADVRCIGDVVKMIPRGMDSRLPGWLYDGPLCADYDEDGEWVVYPAA